MYSFCRLSCLSRFIVYFHFLLFCSTFRPHPSFEQKLEEVVNFQRISQSIQTGDPERTYPGPRGLSHSPSHAAMASSVRSRAAGSSIKTADAVARSSSPEESHRSAAVSAGNPTSAASRIPVERTARAVVRPPWVSGQARKRPERG